MSVTTLLKNATMSQDADEAKVMANVMNNDLLAINKFEGRNSFSPDDAMRVSRILGEYRSMAEAGVTQLKTVSKSTTGSAA